MNTIVLIFSKPLMKLIGSFALAHNNGQGFLSFTKLYSLHRTEDVVLVGSAVAMFLPLQYCFIGTEYNKTIFLIRSYRDSDKYIDESY